MKQFFLLLVFLVLGILNAVWAQPVPYKWGEKWGYKDARSGNILIEPVYASCTPFYGTRAYVSMPSGKRFFIDEKGDNKVDLSKYDSVFIYAEGLCPVRLQATGLWGYIDPIGLVKIPFRYQLAYPFSEGMAAVKKGTKYGYIGLDGKDRISATFLMAYEFKDKLAAVKTEAGFGYINNLGKLVIKAGYTDAGNFQSGFAIVAKGDKQGLIDATGKLVLPLEYEVIAPLTEGYFRLAKDGKWGFADKQGKVVIPLIYDAADDFNAWGLARVRAISASGWPYYGYINAKNEEVIPVLYQWIEAFEGDLVMAVNKGNWICLNKEGKQQDVPEVFKVIRPFYEDRALVSSKGKFGYIDKKGILVIPCQFDYAYDFVSGWAEVIKEEHSYFIDRHGNCIKFCK
jgi:hypothetical protein